MLKARIATAAVLLGIFLSALFMLPTSQFALLIAAVVAVGSHEWAVLARLETRRTYVFSALCTCLFVAMIWGFEAIDPARSLVAGVYAVSALFWLIVAPAWMFRGFRFQSIAVKLLIGVVVVVPTGLSIVSMHYVDPRIVLMLLGLVWIADTAAYFSGRAFGRHKLAPSISPGKTWEGAAGALTATLGYTALCAWFWPPFSAVAEEYGLFSFLVLGGLLCVVSIEGDLFESLFKRNAGAKDSGTLLPGHGGVLDRIDSITSTLPMAALIFHFFAGSA